MTRPTILFIERAGEVGGAERVLLDLVARVDRSRFRTLAVCLADGSLPPALRDAGTPTTVMPVNRFRQVHRVTATLARLVALVRSERVDLLHANGTMMMAYAGPVAGVTGRRLVWHAHDPQSSTGPVRRSFVATMACLRPDWTIFTTPAVEANHAALFRRIGAMSTIPPGVDVDGLADVAPDRSVVTRAVPPDAVLALVLARYIPGKGLEDLIAAMPIARQAVPNLHVLICGGLPAPGYTEALEGLAARHGQASHIHLLGHVPEATKRTLLATCDLLVHPATHEPFGLSVVEAMAAGKPVVAADAVGPSFTVAHETTGLLYPRGDVCALGHHLARLAADPDLRHRLGNAGQRRAAQFHVDAMVDAIESVWTSALAGPSRSRPRQPVRPLPPAAG